MSHIEIKFVDKGPDEMSTMDGGVVFHYHMDVDPRFRHNTLAHKVSEQQIQDRIERAIFNWVEENAEHLLGRYYNKKRYEEYVQRGR